MRTGTKILELGTEKISVTGTNDGVSPGLSFVLSRAQKVAFALRDSDRIVGQNPGEKLCRERSI